MMLVALMPMVCGVNGFAQSNQLMDYDSTTDRTILGIDVDGNGVRDDIDAYIARLPSSKIQKTALLQMAAAESLTMTVNTSDQSQMRLVAQHHVNALACVHNRYEPGLGVQREPGLSKFARKMEIFNLSSNTTMRKQAEDKYYSALTMYSSLPEAVGDGCLK